jgi:hypothetical protein
MRTAAFTTLLVVALTTLVFSQSPSEFRVLYYPDASVATRMEGGVLEIQRDAFRFRANSTQFAWVVDLATVESIVVEPFAGPFRTMSSIVIESVEHTRRVRRRIAAVDDMSLNERAMLAGMLRLRVEQFKVARASLRQ